MYAKIIITAQIEVVTGMHIGGSGAFSAIGAVDSPVVRDSFSGLPIIPGSSLKGKLRTLMARNVEQQVYLKAPEDDKQELRRLFGDQGSKNENATKSRLQFSDAFLENAEDFTEIMPTEVKFENTINRLTAVANPRQIERVTRGAQFGFTLIYDVEKSEELEVDFKNIADGLKLLQLDYLGGHGTRGYGKVRFNDLLAQCVWGEVDSGVLAKLNEQLKEVEKDALPAI